MDTDVKTVPVWLDIVMSLIVGALLLLLSSLVKRLYNSAKTKLAARKARKNTGPTLVTS